MFDFDELSNLISDSLKKIFFPQEWLNLDMKFSKSELFTMLFIEKKTEITMTELAEYIHSPMSTATGIIDRLVKNAYILRERSEQDRRIVVLKLSEKGVSEITKLKELISYYINKVSENLTSGEIQTLTQIALKIFTVLNNEFSEKQLGNQEEGSIKKIDIE